MQTTAPLSSFSAVASKPQNLISYCPVWEFTACERRLGGTVQPPSAQGPEQHWLLQPAPVGSGVTPAPPEQTEGIPRLLEQSSISSGEKKEFLEQCS